VRILPLCDALIGAWFAQHRDDFSEAELVAAARAQLDATPAELERLVRSWRARHDRANPFLDDEDAA
jgi:hypothetical protein